MQRAKETITSWRKLGKYPEAFLHFFFQWTLLNLYYNALSKKIKEPYRVLEFGRKYENLFNNVKNDAIDLIKTECVGEGKEDAPPNSWVKTASLQLRKALNIDSNSVCANCRREKRRECEKIEIEPYTFGKMEALMRILYQIRCNLFHGDKTEYENGAQAERNKFLVKIGNKTLEIFLHSITENSEEN